MAKCVPSILPAWVEQDERRSAEIRVYQKCKEVLNDEWHVFYSRPWWGLNSKGGEKDGEADFILVHPKYGILFLEVKGGRISFDSKRDEWASVDRHDVRHVFPKSPVIQAVNSKHELFKKFSKHSKWPKTRIIVHHGVVFVDTIESELQILGGYEKELFCFSVDFERNFLDWILSRLTGHRTSDESGPGEIGIQVIHEILAKPLELRITLSRASANDVNQMESLLTGLQLQILGEIEVTNRIVIEGGAGTGKTVIACEAAARASLSENEVALCCVGEALLEEFKGRLSKITNNLHILSVENLINSHSKFDVIIIDESQDVDWKSWDIIPKKLRGEDSKLISFMDANQAIYRLATDLATRLQATRYVLRVNLRNTKKIGGAINQFFNGPIPLVCGPEGTVPELVSPISTDDAIISICQKIIDLYRNEGVEYSGIAVLSEDAEFLRRLRDKAKQFNLFCSTAKNRNLGLITVDTIWNFKGLEAPFVFTYVSADKGNTNEHAYVVTSRARTHLFIYSGKSNLTINNAVSKG